MSTKQWRIIGGFAGGAVFLLIVLTVAGQVLRRPTKDPSKGGWNQDAIKATFVATQLHELDKTHSSLILSYDLRNLTDFDYRFAEGPGLVIMSKLRSDGSLSQEEAVHLNYPVFLPAKQHARLAIEISHPFAWPARDDRQFDEKLRDFVKQRLTAVGEFVLFDDASHCQIELPGAWQELEESTQLPLAAGAKGK